MWKCDNLTKTLWHSPVLCRPVLGPRAWVSHKSCKTLNSATTAALGDTLPNAQRLEIVSLVVWSLESIQPHTSRRRPRGRCAADSAPTDPACSQASRQRATLTQKSACICCRSLSHIFDTVSAIRAPFKPDYDCKDWNWGNREPLSWADIERMYLTPKPRKPWSVSFRRVCLPHSCS